MRYVHIDSVETGQYLGKTIFSSNGAVLLAEDVQLTVFMINTLRRIGVTMLYIKDKNFEDVEITEILSDDTKRFVMGRMEETINAIRSGKDFSSRKIDISINQLLDDVLRNKDVLVQLTDIRTMDNSMYVHALNVTMMSVLIGINMNLNHVQLKELAIGALLHDIGKIGLVREEDEKEPKSHHTWRGFEILKNKRDYSLLICHVAFQHHERLDGTGVPRGVSDEQIHIYAKIVAVANEFDNLLYDPKNGNRMLPHDACEHMMALSGTKIDHGVLINFLKTISIYPTGISVKLTNRETGVVVGQHRGLPARPIVRIVKQDKTDELDIKEIDLAKNTTVFIETVLT